MPPICSKTVELDQKQHKLWRMCVERRLIMQELMEKTFHTNLSNKVAQLHLLSIQIKTDLRQILVELYSLYPEVKKYPKYANMFETIAERVNETIKFSSTFTVP